MEINFDENIDVECLCSNHGSWHKSCHLKFSVSKVKKAQKRADRKRKNKEEVPAPTYTERQATHQANAQCLFCKEGDDRDKLRCFSVLETDKSIRQMALKLQDLYEFLFRRWMLSGPELSRVVQQFEDQFLSGPDPDNPKNYENCEAGRAAQKTFHHQVKNLCEVVR